MNLYIIPSLRDDTAEDAVEQLAQVAGVPVYTFSTVYEIIDHTDEPMVIGRVGSELASTIMQVIGQTFEELPTVVIGAPDSFYPTEWTSVFSPLPFLNWSEFEVKLAKSGLLSHTPSQAEERTPATYQGHKTFNSEDEMKTELDDNERHVPLRGSNKWNTGGQDE